jgi:hypothetical protein
MIIRTIDSSISEKAENLLFIIPLPPEFLIGE